MVRYVNSVPELQGTKNYTAWFCRLRNALNCRDLRLWPVLTGEWQPEMNAFISLSEIEIRIHAAVDLDTYPEHLTAIQIAQWEAENIKEPNRKFHEWTEINEKALACLRSTLSSSIFNQVRDFTVAADAHVYLKRKYAIPTPGAWLIKVDALRAITFDPQMRPATFLAKWNEAAVDCQAYCAFAGDQIVGSWYLYAIFVDAVRAHGDEALCEIIQQPDLRLPTLLQDAKRAFERYMDNQKSTCAATKNTSRQ